MASRLTVKSLDVSRIACTPVKPKILAKYLETYPDQSVSRLLTEGFSFGFYLQYSGPRLHVEYENLKSINAHENEAIEVVMKEVELGRKAGPFSLPPLQNLRVSPVGLIPKKDGSWRLIHHLSYPDGSSVNHHIDQNLCTVHYTPFDTALEMLAKLGKGALAARLDIKSAFRLFPIHPSDFELLGYKIDNLYFVDKCLPFGCSISCALFEKFATFLEWELKKRSKSDNVVHYLDDFLVAGEKETDDCVKLMDCYKNLCDELGVPLAIEKTIGPTSCITYLGLEIDTNDMLVRIPSEKIEKLRSALISLINKNKTTLKELQSLTGLMNFCTRAIPSSRAFSRRFYDAMSGLKKHVHKRRVNNEMKEDIRVWLTFLEFFNGSTYYDLTPWVDSDYLKLFTDSAGNSTLGCAAILAKQWVFMPWPLSWHNQPLMKDITFLELVPITLSFFIWGESLRSKKIVLYTDNKALVSVLNKKSCKSARVMKLLRPLVLISMKLDIQFKSFHIEGKHNIAADALSRQQFLKFHQTIPEADGSPMSIPLSFQNLLSSVDVTK